MPALELAIPGDACIGAIPGDAYIGMDKYILIICTLHHRAVAILCYGIFPPQGFFPEELCN